MFRIEPAFPAHAYKTYAFARPLKTHWHKASCEDVDCTAYLNGWVTRIDESTELGRAQAHYLRHDRSRSHAEQKTPDGITEFMFGPGQRCFKSADHKLPIGRDPVFLVKGGDYRGNPRNTPTRICRNAGQWIEDFDEHQHLLLDAIQRG